MNFSEFFRIFAETFSDKNEMNRLIFSFILAIFAFLLPSRVEAQLFWRISGNGLEAPSYLLGSHHLAPKSVIDSIPGLLPAFDEAERVVTEVDMTVPAAQLSAAMTPYMLAPHDSLLTSLFPAAKLEELNSKLQGIFGTPLVSLQMYDALRPMALNNVISLTIMQEALPEYDPNFQMDAWFQTEAKRKGKPIVALETAEQQAALLYNSISIEEQARSLENVLEDPQEVVEEAKVLNALYFSGDLDKMLELSLSTDDSPAFMEALLDRRNADWMQRLPGIMAEGQALIVVGALHLPGEKGLLRQLRRLGYTVEAEN